MTVIKHEIQGLLHVKDTSMLLIIDYRSDMCMPDLPGQNI